MINQLLLEKPSIELILENSPGMTSESAKDLASYHDCLVASYISYLKAAGYSQLLQEIRKFERGARCFLSKFPDHQLWLAPGVASAFAFRRSSRASKAPINEMVP